MLTLCCYKEASTETFLTPAYIFLPYTTKFINLLSVAKYTTKFINLLPVAKSEEAEEIEHSRFQK